MTKKDNYRREMWAWQFVVYTPQKKRFKKTGMCYEITGQTYPFRHKKFNYNWLDAFEPSKPMQKKWKR